MATQPQTQAVEKVLGSFESTTPEQVTAEKGVADAFLGSERVSRKEARGGSGMVKNAAGDYVPVQKKEKDPLASLGSDAPNYKTILAQKTEQARAISDTVKQQFNGYIEGIHEDFVPVHKRQRALNVSGGLQGSDFASAGAQRQEDRETEAVRAKEMERDAKINEIMSGVPSEADESFSKMSETYRLNAAAKLDAVKQFRDEARSTATNILSAIAAGGGNFDIVKGSPSYGKLLEAYGGDENAVKGAYLTAVPEAQKLGSTTVGNKYVTFYYDPITGKKSSIDFDLPANLGADEEVQQVFSNGQVAVKTTSYDANGHKKESIKIVSAGGQARPAEGGGTGDSDYYSPDNKREISQAGLANADQRARDIFINTPTAFRQTYIRNGFGNSEVTPDILLNNLEEWEKTQDSGGDDNPFD